MILSEATVSGCECWFCNEVIPLGPCYAEDNGDPIYCLRCGLWRKTMYGWYPEDGEK